jgi:hypothetical protein
MEEYGLKLWKGGNDEDDSFDYRIAIGGYCAGGLFN